LNLIFEISIHDLKNPPNGNRRSNVRLNLTNAKDLAFSNKGNHGHESRYLITLLEPSSYGLNSTEQHEREHFEKDFILACNLLLIRGCVTLTTTNFHTTRIEEEISDSTNSVERNGNKINIRLQESPVTIKDQVSTGVITNDTIDEADCLQLFKKIRIFNRFQNKGTIRDTNLVSTINKFETAMNQHEILLKFLFLFNSLENIININGTNHQGINFDNQVKTSGINATDVADWRNYYNRIRHAQTKQQQLNSLRNQMIPEWITRLRETVTMLITKEI